MIMQGVPTTLSTMRIMLLVLCNTETLDRLRDANFLLWVVLSKEVWAQLGKCALF